MSLKTDNQRINFASIKDPMPCPDFLEVQLKSFEDFLQLDTPPEKRVNDGLYKVFAENFRTDRLFYGGVVGAAFFPYLNGNKRGSAVYRANADMVGHILV